MAKDSRVLDWYTFLEDKCLTDQLCQAVRIVLVFYFNLWNYFHFHVMQVIYINKTILSKLFVTGLLRFKLNGRGGSGYYMQSRASLRIRDSHEEIKQGQQQELLIALGQHGTLWGI